MIILPDYEMNLNHTTVYISGYGSFGEGFGDGYGYGFTPDHGFGDGCGGYVNGNGDYGYVSGNGDIAFEIMPKKYPHNLIIL